MGWGGVGSAEVADRALRLSRRDALMPSTAPGKARCAALFPPGGRHLVTLGNVADRYTDPEDKPDPPEKSRWEVTQVAVKYITIERRDEGPWQEQTLKLEFSAFLELYDLVNERFVQATVPSKLEVRLSVFADRAGPFNCPVLQGDLLPSEPLRCFYGMSTAVSALKDVFDETSVPKPQWLLCLRHALNKRVFLHGGDELYGTHPWRQCEIVLLGAPVLIETVFNHKITEPLTVNKTDTYSCGSTCAPRGRPPHCRCDRPGTPCPVQR